MARVITTGGWDLGPATGVWSIWVAEIISMLQSAGLVRTTDTGQINEATVNRPNTSNVWAGYAIFRFNDALQATAPIFIKIQFGTGTGVTNPGMSFQIGTGSDGAGNLTGLVSQEHVCRSSSAPGTAIDYISRAIHTAGFAALVYKMGAASASTVLTGAAFIVQRTVDNAGSPTAEGAILITPPTGTGSRSTHGTFSKIIFAGSTVPGPVGNAWLGRAHGQITDSRVGLSPQAFHHWIATPKIKPLAGTVAFLIGEVPLHAQMSLAMVGTTPRNYICIGGEMGYAISASQGSDMAILWED